MISDVKSFVLLDLIMAHKSDGDEDDDKPRSEQTLECAVCLQPSIYPVQLPCSHVFCYLCVKGFTTQSKRCAMCRYGVHSLVIVCTVNKPFFGSCSVLS